MLEVLGVPMVPFWSHGWSIMAQMPLMKMQMKRLRQMTPNICAQSVTWACGSSLVLSSTPH